MWDLIVLVPDHCLSFYFPNLSQKVLVCIISHKLVSRFQPDLHGYNIGT